MSHPYGINGQESHRLATLTELPERLVAAHAADVDARGRFPTESLAALGDSGWLGLCVDPAHGGMGHGPAMFAAVVEELAMRCGSTAMVYVMHVTATQAIAGSSMLMGREALLADIAAGRHLTTLAFSEKGSRSHFWAPVSNMREHDGGFVTTAQKSWVTSADHAHSYVSSSQRPGANSPLESTIYLARTGRPGMR